MNDIIDLEKAAIREFDEETSEMFRSPSYFDHVSNILYNPQHQTIYLVNSRSYSGSDFSCDYFHKEEKIDPAIEDITIASLEDMQNLDFSFQVDKDLLNKLLA